MSKDREIRVRDEFSMDDFKSRLDAEVPLAIHQLIMNSKDPSDDIADDIANLIGKKAFDIACEQGCIYGDLRLIKEYVDALTKVIISSLVCK